MDLFDVLDQEWRTLNLQPSTAATYKTWQDHTPLFGLWPGPDALMWAARRCGESAVSDTLLAHLAARANNDDLAARTVLQALVPGLKLIVARHHWLTDPEDLEATTVAIAWERIRNYPIRRRPRRIAANIILDTGQRLRRSLPDRLRSELPTGTANVSTDDYDLIDTIDLTRRTVDPLTADVILRTRCLDQPVRALADDYELTASALRERRRRGEIRVRRALKAMR
jgi:hypothetical protein